MLKNATTWVNQTSFRLLHGRNLVYNSCWEDPRLDRQALHFEAKDEVAVITSAGCNALDYALAGSGQVHAVDVNPRQNALLELKLAAARALDYESFFCMFGKGHLAGVRESYGQSMRQYLSTFARQYWDRRIGWFESAGWRPSFYFRGTTGLFARLMNHYIDRIAKVRPYTERLLDSADLEEQRQIYETHVRPTFWSPTLRWAVGRELTMALLGVPQAQRQQLEQYYDGGMVNFLEDRLDFIFGQLPLQDNYFWRVYLTGHYTQECCPEYLKRENFENLRGEAWRRVKTYTTTMEDFLTRYGRKITKLVLLDHMDWMAQNRQDLLKGEWEAILAKAEPGARVIWRSAGLKVDFVDPLVVDHQGRQREVGEFLHYEHELAERLHPHDRVSTYGSFYIAELRGN